MRALVLAFPLLFISGCVLELENHTWKTKFDQRAGRFVELRGDIPDILQTDPTRIRVLTALVEKQVGLKKPLVAIIYFVACENGLEEFPESVPAEERARKRWTELGLTDYEECIGKAGNSYPGTPNLWVDPRLWAVERPHRKDHSVWKFWKSGEYTLGHEMLHRGLDMMGIPVAKHHCTMVIKGHFYALAALVGKADWNSFRVIRKSIEEDLDEECNE